MASVSDINTETTLQLYANPLLIQDKQLALFEEHVFEGKSVLDGNNVFTFGLEMGATLAASIVNEMTNSFQTLYPSRAQTMSDLYRHLSDYDYIDMFSTPATTTIELMFERNFLIDNAPEDINEDGAYKIIIPEFSTFTIGNYTFGIHYPIEIKIRKAYKANGTSIDYDKCIFSCIWNTETINPLYRLTTNILEHRMFTKEGLNFLCISVPIHQFKIDIKKEDSISSTGFIKRYTYTDRFYAIRIFHFLNNQWVEMAETLSDVIYNPQILTAKIKVLSDIKTIEVSIPQSYFTDGLVGNRIMCMIYTTEGALDVDIRNYSIDQFGASFLIDDTVVDDTYSAFLKRIPMLKVVPLSSRISNGSNGKTFEEMKNRVINSVGGDDLLVTTKQLEAHLFDTGFKVSKYIDNITDRIYLASKTLTDSNKDVIGSGEFMTTITSDIIANSGVNSTYDTIIKINDDELLILPTTIFKYDNITDSMIPLSRYDRKNLFEDKTKEETIEELNNNTYTFTPFHIKLSTKNELPLAGTFDLLNPKISNISFVAENKYTSTQVSMYGNAILHEDNGSSGYNLMIALYKTDDIKSVQTNNGVTEQLNIILRTRTPEGIPIYMEGTFVGVNSDGKDLIEFHITTDYNLTNKDTIDTTCFTMIDGSSTGATKNFINLTQDYELLFFVHKSFISDTGAITESNNQSNIPDKIKDKNMVWLATQKLTISLGESVSSVRNNVFMTLTGKEYATYPTTEYATYVTDIYKRYTKNITDQETGNILHYAGELVLDSNDLPIVEKYAGDLIIEKPSNEYGIYNPSCKINSQNPETLYLDSPHLSPKSEASNMWYPFRTMSTYLEETDSEKWKAVYTGSDNQLSVIKTKDMLKWIIESILKYNADMIVSGINDKCKYVVELPGEESHIANKICGNFVYVNDISGDTTPPKYFSFSEVITENNVPKTRYVLEKYPDSTDITNSLESILERMNLDTTVHGALYQLDYESSNFDYTPYITEQNLCSLFNDLDNNVSDSVLQTNYNIDSKILKKLKRFRDPWIKLIETRTDSRELKIPPNKELSLSTIRKTNDDGDLIEESYVENNTKSFPKGFIDIAKYWLSRANANFNKELSIKTHGIGVEATLHGLEALAYMQERSRNQNSIKKFNNAVEGITYVNTTNSFRLVWIDNYNRDNDSSKVQYESLIGDLDSNGDINNSSSNNNLSDTFGALLWRRYDNNDHYIVITGPSFIQCYNYLMNCKTSSGYIYETSVYKKPDNFTTDIMNANSEYLYSEISEIDEESEEYVYQKFDELITHEQPIERYISVLPSIINNKEETELFFLEVIWQHKWPWEMENWTIDIHPDTSNIGKPLRDIDVSIEFDKYNKYAKVSHYVGDIILDESGKPASEATSKRNVIYHINAIHCDYKLIKSDNNEHKMYREDLENLLRGYFDLLESTRPLLLERTNLFFTPIKTMGYGVFKGKNGEIINHPLAISVDLRVHINPIIGADKNAKDLVRANIIKLIEEHMSSGNISCTILAEQIRQSMSDTILYVDVLGINGNHDVQTLVSADPSQDSVRLKSKLVLNEDNTVGVEKAVNIEWAIMQ